MLVSYKTEIQPTAEQIVIIDRTIGVCRFVKNLYIETVTDAHKRGEPFISANEFQKWINHTFLAEHPDYQWIKSVSTKSVKSAIIHTETAFLRFFKGVAKYPTYKKKRNNDVSMYFSRNGIKQPILCERHRIKIPTLGWVRLKEKGYLPTSDSNYAIIKGNISKEANRYFISVTVDILNNNINTNAGSDTFGIGIDLGIKELAVLSNGKCYANINKSNRVVKLTKQLRRAERKLSRKLKNKKKGKTTKGKNIAKQILVIQKLNKRLCDIRTNYMNNVIAEIVRTKPSYITIEDLNILGMMQNKHLAKAIQNQKLAEFRRNLTKKCHQHGIELRVVSRWYPSSKKCNCCGNIKKDLKLSDRTYTCDCGYVCDRDLNASFNLRDASEYHIESQ